MLLAVLLVPRGAASVQVAERENGTAMGRGTENRSWTSVAAKPPELISPLRYDFKTQSVQIPMRDGVRLPGRLLIPIRPSGENGPCVVLSDGYATAAASRAFVGGAMDNLLDLVQRGYAGLSVAMRSTGVPEDEAFYYEYGEDGHDIVEWMADQEWCNGNVGMIGSSLNGIIQWETAREVPPHLRAIVPSISCGDCYWYLWYRGGTLPGMGRERRKPPLTPYNEYAAAIRHRSFDSWWSARTTSSEDHEAIARAGIAVLQCGGWDDYIHAGGLRAVEEITAAGGKGMHVIGPCAHGGNTPALAPYDFWTFTVQWLDRFLKGVDNGIDEGPAALIYVEGPNRFRFEDAWPIPDTRVARLYLREQPSGSGVSLNDGSLLGSPPGSNEESVTYDYSPDGPHNDAGGAGARIREDKRPAEKRSLTWTTLPLTDPAEVTGWPSLDFWASATAPDTDFVIELMDVAPDGFSTQVARGWLNAPHYFDRTNPEPLLPEQVYHFEAEMWPVSYVFQAGHRIRVMVSGSDHPGTALNPNPATVTVYQDAEHPSTLELPVVGTARLPTED